MTGFRVDAADPARRLAANVTVWPGANASDGSIRDYLARLLDGLVSEQAIVVVGSLATDAVGRQAAPLQERVPASNGIRSAVLRRNVYLHRSAAAAAMLTCAAIVLNVGPFATARNNNGLRIPIGGQADPAIMEKPSGSGLISGREDVAARPPGQSAVQPEEFSEPTRVSFSMVEMAPSEFPSAGQGDKGSEAEATPAPEDARPAAPVTQSLPDRASPDPAKRDMVVGVWAPDAGTCSARNFRDGVLPTVINTDGAWAGDTFCMFTKQQQMETGWRVVAKCSNPRERWTSHVRLTVNDNRLVWTSKRGAQAYTRCAPDVLMAQAR